MWLMLSKVPDIFVYNSQYVIPEYSNFKMSIKCLKIVHFYMFDF